MALRRWVSLARYDGAQLLIAAQCPPDDRNQLVVRGYSRSDLSAHGFEKRENQIDSIRRSVEWFDKYLKGSN